MAIAMAKNDDDDDAKKEGRKEGKKRKERSIAPHRFLLHASNRPEKGREAGRRV